MSQNDYGDTLVTVSPDADGVLRLGQQEYAATIEEIQLSKDRKKSPDDEATPEEIADNRSALGALGWLATQMRPDLAAGVAMAQRTQAKPTVADLVETNRLIKLARKYDEVALKFWRPTTTRAGRMPMKHQTATRSSCLQP